MNLGPAADDLAATATAFMDRWWDDAVELLWNPPGSFDKLAPPLSLHLVPQTAWYAVGLLLRDGPGDAERAGQAVEALIATQYDEPGTAWHGTYAQFLESPHPTAQAEAWVHYDPNWRQFVGTTFALTLHLYADRLSPYLVAAMESSIDLAAASEPEGRIQASYSNIALMHAWLQVDAGSRTGDAGLVERGTALAAEVVARFDRHSCFEEYGSPTYYGIDLYALALWRTWPHGTPLGPWGERLERELWADVARSYHAGLRNLAGPFTRSYGMDLRRYAAALALWVWAAMGREAAPFPEVDRPFEHSHDLCLGPCAALLAAPLPDEAAGNFRSFTGERLVRRVVSSSPRRVATAWLAAGAMVGAEDNEGGWAAWHQYHPATVHWRLVDGDVGWIRLVHPGPTSARAGPHQLTATCADHGVHGPQETTFVIAVPDLDPAGIAQERWSLPGLDVKVETAAEFVAVSDVGETFEVRYRPGIDAAGSTTFRLGIVARGRR